MNCEQWREIASEYVEKTLTGSRQAEADAHLAACGSCREDAAALRGIATEMRLWPEEETPLFFAENVLARIDRESRQERGWRALLPRLGRVGVGTVLAGGALAALALTVLFPNALNRRTRLAGVVPESAAVSAAGAAPRLAVRWTQRADANDPTLDVALTLENAPKGTARCELVGDATPYRFAFTGGVPQTLKIPLAAARGEKTLAVKVTWSVAEGASHQRHLILPLPQTDAAPAARQSFAIRDLPLPEAARELSARYGQAVLLDDVPADSRIALSAREETAEQALRRQVEPLGLTVKTVGDALQVTRNP